MVTTIAEILPQAARKHGDRVALIIDSRRLTFRQLDALSNRAANGLVAGGVQPGDRVTLYGPNCWEWLVAYYGIAKTGAVVIPLSVMLTPDEVRYVVEDSGARAVVASPDKGELLHGLEAEGRRCNVVLWGDAPVAGATASPNGWTARPEFSPVRGAGGDLAAICYTSGTTGRPKGAMQSRTAPWSAPPWARR